MTVDSGIVYIVVTAMISMQGWILLEVVGMRGRLHRLEAKEIHHDAELGSLKTDIHELRRAVEDSA